MLTADGFLASLKARALTMFATQKRVLSLPEYIALFVDDPGRLGRDASQYVADAFRYFGSETTASPARSRDDQKHYRLFDLGFVPPQEQRDKLIGQHAIAGKILQILESFAAEGRPNKLILLHGPNGSAKSTIARCMMQALEHYSTLDEGATYRFHWVFPATKLASSKIGFREVHASIGESGSYAYLPDELVDARVANEVGDHPLFLIPTEDRRQMLKELEAKSSRNFPQWLLRGQLSQKSQQIFDALLRNHQGNLDEVFRHVCVERVFISRRYRRGAVTIGPQMTVDASEHQVTMDRSMAMLPAALTSLSLFDVSGEWIDAAGGLLEFSDLLKRPIDAYKYLQLSVETGEISLPHQIIGLNCVCIGSANEAHLAALREHHEWESFRSRFELIAVPYLRSYLEEERIYEEQIAREQKLHVAPYSMRLAALFAAMTRLHPVPGELHLDSLSVLEKADLFALGTPPARYSDDQKKRIRNAMPAMLDHAEEAMFGASPREIKSALLDAASRSTNNCLSPHWVLEALERLTTRTSEFEWLKNKPAGNGYFDSAFIVKASRDRLHEWWESDLYMASGLVSEQSWIDLFERYVRQVSAWSKGEKVKNSITGEYEDSDESLMRLVENQLGVVQTTDHRNRILSMIGGFRIEHPNDAISVAHVFPEVLRKLQDSAFAERKKKLQARLTAMQVLLENEHARLQDESERAPSLAANASLREKGYCNACLAEALGRVLRERFET
jgi:predicted Ser/Thr protein kinase